MNYCIRCDFDPCVCIKEPIQSLTIEVDKETYKFIEQRAGSNSVGEQAASGPRQTDCNLSSFFRAR